MGLRVLIYVDGLIILNQDSQNLIQDRDLTLWLLQMMGFVINWEKSALQLAQSRKYLSFNLIPRQWLSSCWTIIAGFVESVPRSVSKTVNHRQMLPASLHYRNLQMQNSWIRGNCSGLDRLLRRNPLVYLKPSSLVCSHIIPTSWSWPMHPIK